MPQAAGLGKGLGKGIDALGAEPTSEGEMPLVESVREWVQQQLRPQGFALPLIKRVSFVVAGLLKAESARRGDLVTALDQLKASSAQSASVARRVVRTLNDPRLDPERILPNILKPHLPILLAEVIHEHEVHKRSSASKREHERDFPLLRVVVDESTKVDEVHILVAGLAYQGIVIPLAIRVWPQNQSLPPEEYRSHLVSLLSSVQDILPGVLRQHILLLADRAYGRSDFIDLVEALDWHYVIRIQGQTQIKLSDGTSLAAHDFVKQPGEVWCSGFNPDSYPKALAAFKKSGWRACQFVAAWAPAAKESWLLITNLSATKERFLDYAERWTIERTFLAWKSHGWDIESLQMSSPSRLGRYLVAIALATIWTLACAVAHTIQLIEVIEDRQASPRAPRRAVVQLPLPFAEFKTDRRPELAKASLLTWGRRVLHQASCQTSTPPIRWRLPDWHAPAWFIHSTQLLATDQ
jgi:Transposase DDE domain